MLLVQNMRHTCLRTSSLFCTGGEGRKLWRAPATPLWSVLVSTCFRSGNSADKRLLMACAPAKHNISSHYIENQSLRLCLSNQRLPVTFIPWMSGL